MWREGAVAGPSCALGENSTNIMSSMPQYCSMSEFDNFDSYLVSHRVRTVEKRLFQVDLMVMQNCPEL